MVEELSGELVLYNTRQQEEFTIQLKREQLKEVIEFLDFAFTSIEPETISYQMLSAKTLRQKNQIITRSITAIEEPESKPEGEE